MPVFHPLDETSKDKLPATANSKDDKELLEIRRETEKYKLLKEQEDLKADIEKSKRDGNLYKRQFNEIDDFYKYRDGEKRQIEKDKQEISQQQNSLAQVRIQLDQDTNKAKAILDNAHEVSEALAELDKEKSQVEKDGAQVLANIKVAQTILNEANTKNANYKELQVKKCAECLARDKRKCEKCSYRLYSEVYKKDYEKWLTKMRK